MGRDARTDGKIPFDDVGSDVHNASVRKDFPCRSNAEALRLRLSSADDSAERNTEEFGLVARVRDSDTVAFELLFARYFRVLHAFANAYVHSQDAAEDIVQDVFARLWDDRARWQVRTNVKAYLFTAVRNQALNTLRDTAAATRREEKYMAAAESLVVASTGTARLEEAELRQYIARAVEGLSPRCREVFLLSRTRHLNQREIAEVLKIALPTVKVQLGKAFRAIAAACRHYEQDTGEAIG